MPNSINQPHQNVYNSNQNPNGRQGEINPQNFSSNLRQPILLHTINGNQTQTQDFVRFQQVSNTTIGSGNSSSFQNNLRLLPRSFSSNSSFNSDKVTSIIQNWDRLRSLINDYFNGDLNFMRPNLHIVLSGKAKNWFWSYHKKEQPIIWEDFCNAIRDQYKDFKTTFDIREEIRNRKQKPAESFDMFYDSIASLIDRLPNPLSEVELFEIITRNLRPEIRHELLFQPIYSISNLRKLVQMRESFLSDEYVRRNFMVRNPNKLMTRRQVSEIDYENMDLDSNMNFAHGSSVDAVHKPDVIPRCWNCDQILHFYEDCLQDRTIFCYGCGAKNTYRPQCSKCLNRKATKNSKLPVPPKEQA